VINISKVSLRLRSDWHWASHWAKSKCDNKKCECKKYCYPIKINYSVAQAILSVPFYYNQLILIQIILTNKMA